MSSFTSEEVEFLRARGNVYCAKVWLGLYDKSHSGRVDVKDDDALKEFIIQVKYSTSAVFKLDFHNPFYVMQCSLDVMTGFVQGG